MAVKPEDIFIDDCAFAKVVTTAKGDALLVGHRVIQFGDGEAEAVELLSVALRRLSCGGMSKDSSESNVAALIDNQNQIAARILNLNLPSSVYPTSANSITPDSCSHTFKAPLTAAEK